MKQSVPSHTFVYAGLFFGIGIGILLGFMNGNIYLGIVLGLLGGIAFALALRSFIHKTETTTDFEQDEKRAEFEEGEVLLGEGPANHFKGAESVGGRLFLTNRRLRFRSHTFNMQVHDESYLLDDILSATPVATLWIIPNGLLVTLKDGRRERFVVYDRTRWIQMISKGLQTGR